MQSVSFLDIVVVFTIMFIQIFFYAYMPAAVILEERRKLETMLERMADLYMIVKLKKRKPLILIALECKRWLCNWRKQVKKHIPQRARHGGEEEED